VVTLVSGILLILEAERPVAMSLDFFFALMCLFLYIRRKHVSLDRKVITSLCLLLVFSANSFSSNGFLGQGLLALAMLVMIATSFLDRLPALTFIALSLLLIFIMMLALMFGWLTFPNRIVQRIANPFDWFLQIIALTLFSVIAYFSVRYIRTLLIESITNLRGKVSELESTREEIQRLAYYDQLTGLPNRNLFTREISDQITAGIKEARMVCMRIFSFISQPAAIRRMGIPWRPVTRKQRLHSDTRKKTIMRD